MRALVMLEQVPGDDRITVGGDKGFDAAEFIDKCRYMNVTPHVAQNTSRPGGSAIDARTTRHAGYARQPEEEKAHRGVLRMAERHCAAAQTETSRSVQGGVDFHLRGSGLQPGADAKADSDSGSGLSGP